MPEVREEIGRALYDHWVEEDFANEYCSWDQLPDKAIWLSRADRILAIPAIAEALAYTRLSRQLHEEGGYPSPQER
jgi:hypothetical protein